MKRVLSILLSLLLLVVTLTACGGGDEKKPTGNGSDAPLTREDNAPLTREDDPAPSSDIGGAGAGTQGSAFASGDLQSMVEGTNRNNLTPDQIAELEADAAASGYEIEWQSDGTMVIIEDGNALTFGGKWPENEFTAGVPKPDESLITAVEETEDDCTLVMSWTEEEAKAYTQTLKDAGFDRVIDEQTVMGIYNYRASNGAITVSVSLMGGTGGLIVEKTDPDELEYAETNDAPDVDLDDIQQQIDDALEGVELPEGYEQYMPEGVDIGALLGGLGG